VAGALSLSALAALHGSNPALYARLTGRALPLVVLAGVCGLAVLVLLTVGRTQGARVIAALGVAAVVWGWGVAQYPVLLRGTAVTLSNAGAPDATLVALVILFVVAVLLIGPSFALLYTMQNRRLLGAGEPGGPAGLAARRTGPSASPPLPSTARHAGTRAAVLAVIILNAIARRRRYR
jgi:cytochrome bd ubiquinol oxidase subunit II